MALKAALFTGGLAILVVAASWMNLFSQQIMASPAGSAAGEMQVLSTLLPTGVQQIVIVDARAQAMTVYHVEPALGKIQLRSVRNVRMDLAVEDFNGTEPLPREMRLLKP